MTQDTKSQLYKYSRHFASLSGSNCRIVDMENHCLLPEVFGDSQDFSKLCKNKSCNLFNTFSYGCSEAYRWNGKYIFYCPEGLVFVAASVSSDIGKLCAGLVLGPLVMGDVQDTMDSFKNPAMSSAANTLPCISTRKTSDIAEIMAGITEHISGVAHSMQGDVSFKQENFLKSLYSSHKFGDDPCAAEYPIATEKQLQRVIKNGDKSGAQSLLNELLGKIYVLNNFDVELIKIRMIELLSVLSRATIDAGADISEIIWFNTGCIRAMQKCETIEELSVWITEIMHRFIRYSFDFSSIKHSDTVYKVIDFIRATYYKKISLDDISKQVNFSKTYLSRIFKEETGENISTYINKIRIEKAKNLLTDKSISLVDVANMTGFEDQSYFTKVFKSVVGCSPKKFKESSYNAGT